MSTERRHMGTRNTCSPNHIEIQAPAKGNFGLEAERTRVNAVQQPGQRHRHHERGHEQDRPSSRCRSASAGSRSSPAPSSPDGSGRSRSEISPRKTIGRLARNLAYAAAVAQRQRGDHQAWRSPRRTPPSNAGLAQLAGDVVGAPAIGVESDEVTDHRQRAHTSAYARTPIDCSSRQHHAADEPCQIRRQPQPCTVGQQRRWCTRISHAGVINARPDRPVSSKHRAPPSRAQHHQQQVRQRRQRHVERGLHRQAPHLR